MPLSLADVPALLERGRMPLDVALIQVAPPDGDGMCSLGISVDVTRAAALTARRVIAEVNPAMPRTRGDAASRWTASTGSWPSTGRWPSTCTRRRTPRPIRSPPTSRD